MMKHIYLFTEQGPASRFGIGTYIKTISRIIKERSNFRITIVSLLEDTKVITCDYYRNIRVILIPGVSIGKDKYFRNVAYILCRYISKEEENIFHYNFMNCYDLVVHLKELFEKSRSLLTIHYSDCDIQDVNSPDLKETESQLMHTCDHIITLSEYRKDYVSVNYGIPKQKVTVLKHVLPNIEKAQQTDVTIMPKHPYVLFVGRLDENKGISLLVEAFKRIAISHHELSLIVVGDGPLLSPLLRDGISLKYNIFFTGYLKRDEINTLYNGALLGVIPSRYEEYGLVATEMRNAQLKILANTNFGLSSALDGYQNAIFMDFNRFRTAEEKINVLYKALWMVLNDAPDQIRSSEDQIHICSFRAFDDYSSKMISIYNDLFER